MDISVSGGAPAKEAATTAKSGKVAGKGDTAGHKGGFFDALSKANSQTSGAEADATGTQETDQLLAGAHVGKASSARGRNGKPLIDVSDQSLKGQADVQADKIAGAANVKITAKMPAADDGEATDKTAAEKFTADDLKTKTGAHAPKGAKTTKADAADKDDSTDADDSAASDVLGLLNKDPGATIGASTVLTVAAANAAEKTPRVSAPDKKTDGQAVKAVDTAGGDAADALAAISSGGSDAQVPGTEGADATEGKTFKISRADGRGQSVNMRSGGDASDELAAAGKKGDVENVTVLDSRRYLGFAQNSNSAAVTAAISGDKEWATAMQPSSALSNAAEWTSTGKVVNTLKIQMNPLDLGLVTATMRLSGDALNVDLKVESGAAYRQLKEDHGKMVEALRSQGYMVDSVTISMAPSVDRQDTGSQTGSQSQTFQQSSAQQGQGHAARERNNQTQWTDGGFNGAGETGVEDASAGRTGSGSAGGVYL